MAENKIEVTHLLGKKLDKPILIKMGLKTENKMAEVAAMFGKKLDEQFEVGIYGELKSKRHKCKLTEGGLYEWYEDWQKWVFDPDGILYDLLTGDAEIEGTEHESHG